MFNIDEYKITLEEKLRNIVLSDIRKVKGDMHKAIDSQDFDMLENLKDKLSKLEELSNDFTLNFGDDKQIKNSDVSEMNFKQEKNGDEIQLVFDLESCQTKEVIKPNKRKMIPDKMIVRHHLDLPIMTVPERIYIDMDELIFSSKTWKGAFEEVCEYCYKLDSQKYKEMAISDISNRIKDAKVNFNYAIIDDNDFKCYHGVWFYVRMSGQDAVKLMFEVLDFMGFTEHELVVARRRR